MPGGKVVVYTGTPPGTKDEAGRAVVMGREIARGSARHGSFAHEQEVRVVRVYTLRWAPRVCSRNLARSTVHAHLQFYVASSTREVATVNNNHGQ